MFIVENEHVDEGITIVGVFKHYVNAENRVKRLIEEYIEEYDSTVKYDDSERVYKIYSKDIGCLSNIIDINEYEFED